MDMRERILQFEARHGAAIMHRGFVYFEDGARREENPYGMLAEPPEDRPELAKAILFYRELALGRAVKQFEEQKSHFAAAAAAELRQPFCGPPPMAVDKAEELLTELQNKVTAAREARDKAAAEVQSTKPEWMQDRDRTVVANRQANERLLSLLAKHEV